MLVGRRESSGVDMEPIVLVRVNFGLSYVC